MSINTQTSLLQKINGATFKWLRFFIIAIHVILPTSTQADGNLFKGGQQPVLASFIYIEPFEVRHEILVKVKDMEAWLPLELKGDEIIEVDELEALKLRIAHFLMQHNPLNLEGQKLKPVLDRSHYVQVNAAGIQSIENPTQLSLSTASIGIVLAYFTKGIPRSLTLNWDLFNQQVQQVPVTALDPVSDFTSYVTVTEPVFSWPNFPEDLELIQQQLMQPVQAVIASNTGSQLTLPIWSALCWLLAIGLLIANINKRRQGKMLLLPRFLALSLVVAGWGLTAYGRIELSKPAFLQSKLNQGQAKILLGSLLKNVYRAFEFRDEAAVYDKLALTVAGDLLETVYLQNRQSLAVNQAGGAQAKVRAVQVLDVFMQPEQSQSGTYSIRAQWSVLGSVGHWGHIHRRKNLYKGVVTFAIIEGHWKITELELLEETRMMPGEAELG